MRAAPELATPASETRPTGRPAAELLPATPIEPIAPVLDVEAMCALYRVSRAVLYRGIAAGHIPRARAIGGSRRWIGAEVAASLAARMADAGDEA